MNRNISVSAQIVCSHTSLTCRRGHGIAFHNVNAPKMRENGQGGTHAASHLNLVCAACGQNCEAARFGGSFSCVQQCDFDLCVFCVRCAGGHTMQQCKGEPYGPGVSIRCARCPNILTPRVKARGFMRCQLCKYDVCPGCIPRY